MKLVLVALALVAAVAAIPQKKDEVPQIIRSNSEQTPEGGYNFVYESSDGIVRQETGEVKTVNDEDNKPQQVVVVKGSYQYNSEEGKPISVQYYADESGYHAEGDSIPKNP